MKTKWKIAIALTAVLLVVVPLVLELSLPRFFDAVIVPYQVGDEIISCYPLGELSLNFTSWNTTKHFHESGFWFDAENGSSLIIFRFTLRNISNETVNLGPSFIARLNAAYMPVMGYRGTYENGSYYGGEEQVQGSVKWIDKLFPDEPVLSSHVLEANQTAKGVLVYQTFEGHQPTRLTLRPWTDESNVMLELALE